MKTFPLTLILVLFFSLAFAGGNKKNYDVVQYYASLSKSYENGIMREDYQSAYSAALKQLDLDPSDTAAYLRLAIALKFLDTDKEKILREYSPMISERDPFHAEIKSIANLLLESSTKKK